MKPPVLVLHAAGTNRDLDVAEAVTAVGGAPEIVPLAAVMSGQRRLADYRMLILPGGFSFGDDLGAGRVFSLALRHGLRDELTEFVEAGRPVLGICNGFQALIQSGLLHTGTATWATRRPATLTHNESGRFECRWVELQPEPSSPCIFTRNLVEPIHCPVAHGQGRVVTRDEDALRKLEDGRHIALRYRGSGYPNNPNGSVADIAGLCNAAGNVFGLMPHPENHIHPEQHPRFQSERSAGSGRTLFENGVSYAGSL